MLRFPCTTGNPSSRVRIISNLDKATQRPRSVWSGVETWVYVLGTTIVHARRFIFDCGSQISYYEFILRDGQEVSFRLRLSNWLL